MIGVLAQGGLGNQMFQFAFAWSASKSLRTSFFLQHHSALSYFKLYDGFEFKNRLRKRLGKLVVKSVIDWPNQLGGTTYLLKDIKNNTYYEGYWQSEDYFSQYASDIRKMFEIKEEYKSGLKAFQNKIGNTKYVAIHIRRGDYLNHGDDSLGGKDLSLPISYYKNCLKQIGNLNDHKVVFVSNDIEFVRKEFGTESNYYFEKNDEITDFQILQHANVLVIANSTFSWWAAWLNNSPSKKIYAPEYFLGFKVNKYYPAGIKASAWEWINVN